MVSIHEVSTDPRVGRQVSTVFLFFSLLFGDFYYLFHPHRKTKKAHSSEHFSKSLWQEGYEAFELGQPAGAVVGGPRGGIAAARSL